ncbi:MAG: hypothetical protein PWP76_388 [Candidatus Diapherotrites archaeon]|nr:hypothetical protein [Candidatus Diapherotrites archaeon]
MRKGQAFEVFRLLIAAVVAMVILMVLFNVLNLVRPPGTQPSKAVKSLLEEYIQSGGGSGVEVEFERDTIVNVGNIVENELGYSESMVCVVTEIRAAGINNSLCGSDFKCDSNNKTIQYTGGSKRRKARIYVYCDDGVCGGNDFACAVTVTPPTT